MNLELGVKYKLHWLPSIVGKYYLSTDEDNERAGTMAEYIYAYRV